MQLCNLTHQMDTWLAVILWQYFWTGFKPGARFGRKNNLAPSMSWNTALAAFSCNNQQILKKVYFRCSFKKLTSKKPDQFRFQIWKLLVVNQSFNALKVFINNFYNK